MSLSIFVQSVANGYLFFVRVIIAMMIIVCIVGGLQFPRTTNGPASFSFSILIRHSVQIHPNYYDANDGWFVRARFMVHQNLFGFFLYIRPFDIQKSKSLCFTFEIESRIKYSLYSTYWLGFCLACCCCCCSFFSISNRHLFLMGLHD